jgi:hypothetical protein
MAFSAFEYQTRRFNTECYTTRPVWTGNAAATTTTAATTNALTRGSSFCCRATRDVKTLPVNPQPYKLSGMNLEDGRRTVSYVTIA